MLVAGAIALVAGAASGSAPGQSDSRRVVIRLISEDAFGGAKDKPLHLFWNVIEQHRHAPIRRKDSP